MPIIKKSAAAGFQKATVKELASKASYLAIGVSFLLFGFAFYKTILVPLELQRSLRSESNQQQSPFQPLTAKPVENYVDALNTHSLFYIPKVQAVASAGPGFSEIIAQYELTGIIQGAEPEAIIQNRSTKQTHFAQIGDEVEQIKVVSIQDHSVTVSYQGQESELSIQG